MKMTKIPLLVLGTALLYGCGLKIAGIDVGKTFEATSKIISDKEYTEEQKVRIGQDMTAIILGASAIHPNEELQQYVNKVGYWIAMHSEGMETNEAGKQWQFIVIDSKDFNAFAMPGGYVVISSGAISMLSSEAELAAILAHEIIHIEQDHHIKAMNKSDRYAGASDLLFMAADAKASRDGSYLDQSNLQKRLIAEGLVTFTHSLYTKGLSRDDELDADSKAVVLMARAGYDSYAYISVLQRLDSINPDRKALLLSTHPPIPDRLAVAMQSIEAIDGELNETQSVAARFQSITSE